MLDKKPLNFVFFGIAGSGKGTQVELLQNYLIQKDGLRKVVFVSPGIEYRKIVGSQSYTGERVNEIMGQGALLPDLLTTSLVISSIANEITSDAVLIADGYPRTVSQAMSLEEILIFYQRNGAHVIYLEVGREEALKRMKLRARPDDTDASIEKRFDEYVNNVLHAMNYFQGKSGYFVHTINGEQSIEAVHAEIISALGI